MGAGKVAVAAGVAFLLTLGGTVAISSATAACGGGSVNLASVGTSAPVAGYSGDQLVIAGTIINAAAELELDTRAAVIAVMTGMGESSLRNLNHGDAVDNTTIGVFQQGEDYGPRADRLDPKKAATAFLTRLVQVPGWATMPPSLAAHEVQINQDPDHYTKFYPAAVEVVQALTSSASGGACSVGGDSQALAQELMTAAGNGQLRVLEPRYLAQIEDVAAGQKVPNCGIDVSILQIMVLAVRSFETVGVSDINRKCTGSQLGAGTGSSHWIEGGGKAVDFYALGGTILTGTDPQSIRLISMLDPIMPAGSRVGQVQCRAEAGISLGLRNMREFDDTCNHLHIDLAYAKGPLNVGG
ncbi:hypothetical protein [Agromyces cerinus]|uniref:Uncharacterized protein n=1 Tax=Agromyces cerinus subsp. cerinus TaxID=232089 RepID=A0A1N6IEE1_9MICO|nr:hypothetical protein [Agromyces cerinus]SIO30341.1 hypothetical protein SAMN05443544_3940 [Agromyces cerinus subsp. cerinus]